MAKVIMTCGKICVGKSTYAKKIKNEINAVILSVDEITLALFGNDAGEKHDFYVEQAEKYLYKKSLEIISIGVNVILDWGFWTKSERDYARRFYKLHNIENEFHYIYISDNEWQMRIEKRNNEIKSGKVKAYYIDSGLAQKFEGIFEPPNDNEIDLKIDESREKI